MRIQANTVPYPSENVTKYEVGRLLRFTQHDPEEYIVSEFKPGDLLRVCDRNACGMGIDVTRIRDGMFDMVWANEVELIA